MASKILWILGVGIPMYYLIYSGLANLVPIINYGFALQLDPLPAILAIGLGGVGSYGLYYHYSMRMKSHGKHCELTSFAELGLVGAIVTGLLVIGTGFLETQWFAVLIVAFIGGGIGVILYRYERKKKLLPF